MSTSHPAGSRASSRGLMAPVADGDSPAVVLILCAAPWALPSRPAPTVVQELGRGWGTTVHTIVLNPPTQSQREHLDVDAFPTWFVCLPASPQEEGSDQLASVGFASGWRVHDRRVGAMPKHAVRDWVASVAPQDGTAPQ